MTRLHERGADAVGMMLEGLKVVRRVGVWVCGRGVWYAKRWRAMQLKAFLEKWSEVKSKLLSKGRTAQSP